MYMDHRNIDTAQKPRRFFLGKFFFSVTETDETIKIYKEYSKMD